jgi:NADP-dependent 3-hydroxy acid dehydrogenase YdfG
MVEANLTGLIRMTRELLPGLIRRKKGHVINISSLAAHGVYEGGGVYAAVKHAVRTVSQTLRLELSGTDIRVTDIAPGMAETEFSIVRMGDEQKAKAVYAGMRPLTARTSRRWLSGWRHAPRT